ncbi:MAG: GHKL domain-containing protein [Defluviitaleaceae bacterium]|nr:GHKL domain-containing protein [Defluviitaleaceae bacterium]
MRFEFIIVEIMAIFVEVFACIYFLRSRFASKYVTNAPELICGAIIVIWGFLAFLFSLPGYDVAFMLLLSVYVFFAKLGKLLTKILGIVMLVTIMMVTSILGASIVAMIMGVTIGDTLEDYETSRLVAIIFIKMMQVVLLYTLSKRHISIHSIQKIPTIIVGIVMAVIFVFALVIRAGIDTIYLDNEQSSMLIWASVGLLFIIIAIFLVYEMFVREEAKNTDLVMSLQRVELERGFFNEINSVYTDIRVWRHEYMNNLTVLRDLAQYERKDKIISYIDKISGEPAHFKTALHTGNLILDAIVSSKLALAQKQGIEVNIHAVYPKDNSIDDSDLCIIIGNLLDNAIEACGALSLESDKGMDIASERRFIDFVFLAKGKNLFISVKNSYFTEIKQDKGRYITRKDSLFHGIGLQLLDAVIRKYDGHVMRNHEKGVFETNIILPLVPSGEIEKSKMDKGG